MKNERRKSMNLEDTVNIVLKALLNLQIRIEILEKATPVFIDKLDKKRYEDSTKDYEDIIKKLDETGVIKKIS